MFVEAGRQASNHDDIASFCTFGGMLDSSDSDSDSSKGKGNATAREEAARYQVLSDPPCYGLIPTVAASLPQAALIATNRSRADWITSMMRNAGAGWPFLRELLPIVAPYSAAAAAAAANGGSSNTDNNSNSRSSSSSRSSRSSSSSGGSSSSSSRNNDNNGLVLLNRWTRETLGQAYDAHQRLLQQYGIPTISLEDRDSAKFDTLLSACPAAEARTKAVFGTAEKNRTWVCSNAIAFTGDTVKGRHCSIIDGRPLQVDAAAQMPMRQMQHRAKSLSPPPSSSSSSSLSWSHGLHGSSSSVRSSRERHA
jgi:hypothetical protein